MIGSIDGNTYMVDPRAALFKSRDTDGNGILSMEEMESLVDKLNETADEGMGLEEFIARLDADSDGGVTLEEFQAAQGVNGLLPPPPEAAATAASEEGGHRQQGHGHKGQEHGEGHHNGRHGAHRGIGHIRGAHSGAHNEKWAGEDGVIDQEEMTGLVDTINDRLGKELDADTVFTMLDKNENGEIGRRELQGLRHLMGPPRRKYETSSETPAPDVAPDATVMTAAIPEQTTLPGDADIAQNAGDPSGPQDTTESLSIEA